LAFTTAWAANWVVTWAEKRAKAEGGDGNEGGMGGGGGLEGGGGGDGGDLGGGGLGLGGGGLGLGGAGFLVDRRWRLIGEESSSARTYNTNGVSCA